MHKVPHDTSLAARVFTEPLARASRAGGRGDLYLGAAVVSCWPGSPELQVAGQKNLGLTLVRDCGPEWPELARKLGVGGVSDTNEQDPVQSVKGPADAYGADVCTRGHRQAIMNGLGLILELGVFGACGSPTTADGSVDEASSTRTPE